MPGADASFDNILAAAEMEIVPDEAGNFLLRDVTTGLYRTAYPLDSHYAWVDRRLLAARFSGRRRALAVAKAYARGKDRAGELARPGGVNLPEYFQGIRPPRKGREEEVEEDE